MPIYLLSMREGGEAPLCTVQAQSPEDVAKALEGEYNGENGISLSLDALIILSFELTDERVNTPYTLGLFASGLSGEEQRTKLLYSGEGEEKLLTVEFKGNRAFLYLTAETSGEGLPHFREARALVSA